MDVTQEMIEKAWRDCGVIQSPERDMTNEQALAIRIVMLNHRRKLVERRLIEQVQRLREIKSVLAKGQDPQEALETIRSLVP